MSPLAKSDVATQSPMGKRSISIPSGPCFYPAIFLMMLIFECCPRLKETEFRFHHRRDNLHQMKTIFFLILLGTFAMAIVRGISNDNDPVLSARKNEVPYHDIVQAIKAKYDQQLDALTGYKASHYATRIYRMSGDTAYLDYNVRDLKFMLKEAERLLQVAQGNSVTEYSKTKAESGSSSPRAKLRRQSLSVAPDFPYYLHSLGVLRRAFEYRVCAVQFEQLKRHILAHDYAHYFSNPVMIQAWAAQLANAVVWLKLLGGEDYSDLFIHALQQVYPDDQDHLLSEQQYRNKLYGLTHILLANSQYYQRAINRADFAWIFDYFDTHIDTIIARTRVDVIAEVGIAYLLAEEFDHPALEKAKHHIVQQYNATHQMIPGQNGNLNISAGSHRNILSIILLSTPRKLYPGPWLSELPEVTQC